MAALNRFATAADTAAAIARGGLRAADHARVVLATINEGNAAVNAFVEVTAERAVSEASALDTAMRAGIEPGPLAGVPFAVKSNYDVAGLTTVAGSKINRDLPPAQHDATLVARLRAAGAILVGTLNMDEYAFGFTTENSHYGPTRNPHDPTRVAGGSSGGCGAAVAAGLVPFALGTDTNGSIRVPSAHCGVMGLKPTYGRLARTGTFPFVTSLDHVGPIARSVADLALVYDILQGPDAEDPVCLDTPAEPIRDRLAAGGAGLRIARATGYFERNAMAQTVQLVELAAAALGSRTVIDIANVAQARSAAFIITAVEGAQLHLPNLRTRANDFEPLIRDRLLANALIPGAWYVHAQRLRRVFHQQMMGIFRDIDVILAPATPTPATRIGQEMMVVNGEEMLTRPNTGLLTQPISFIGLPVVTVPIGRVDGMPVGMQIIAAPWREDLCLRVARALESEGIARCEAPQS